MCAVVLAHVDQFGSFLNGTHRGIHYLAGFAYESHHRTVCGLARIDIKQFNFAAFFYFGGYSVYDSFVSSLGEVGDTFYNLFHVSDIRLRVI
jgi:hypothetical protein